MKTIYGVIAFILAVTVFIGSSSVITSCKKTINNYDTVTIITHDTTIVVVRDSIWDLTSGLVASYNFNGGSIADSMGLNNISFNSATPTTDRRGVANNAFLFNGTSSYMTVPNSTSLSPGNITLFAIVKVNGFYMGECHASNILSKGTPDNMNGFYALRITDLIDPGASCSSPIQTDKEYFFGQFGNNIPQGSGAGARAVTPVQTAKWYAIAFTYDGRYARFYLDGVLAQTIDKGYVPMTPNSNSIFIGKHDSSIFPYYFNGVIDELKIYNHALSPFAIRQLSRM
jgi:hypothetical protein